MDQKKRITIFDRKFPMSILLWLLSFLCSLYAIIYYNGADAKSAVQQAALASMTLVVIILPYCLARAYSEIEKRILKSNQLTFDKIKLSENTIELNMKLEKVVDCIQELQKMDLIYKIINFSCFEITYEVVSERIEFLKILLNKKIISQEEFEQLKTKLLTLLKNELNAKLKKQ